ncbi:antitoxin MazE7 [Streptomyces jeddahensis]|nr:antitoxin MazE7 [Streptomyces jeddahensis]
MADTSVRIDTSTRDRLKALAAARGQSLAAYLDDLSKQEEHQAQLARATAAFNRVLDEPGIFEAFDEAFGGVPESSADSHSATRRAA